MTGGLQEWLRRQPVGPIGDPPERREGRMLRFERSGSVLGRPRYIIFSVRGRFDIGTIAYSNQWGYYGCRIASDVPINKEILGEIYAMLKELGS